MVAIAASTTTAGGEIPALLGERRKILLIALPLLSSICLASVYAINALPNDHRWEVVVFTIVGSLFALLAVLLKLSRLDYRPAAYATIALAGGVLLIRMAALFTSGVFDDPSRSLFMAVYAYYPIFYLLAALLLPYPQSARVGVAMWLTMATIATVGTHPYWNMNPPRQLLSALMVYVWLGNGLLVTLLFSWARQQQSLLSRYADLAEVERQARAEQNASELRFRSVFDQAAAGMALIDDQGRWLQMNQCMADLTGYSREELIGRKADEVTPPEDRAAFAKRLQSLAAHEGANYSIDRRLLRKNDEIIWLHVHLRRVPAQADLPGHAVWVAIDINERKLAEQRAAEHQRVRDFHFENTPLAVIEWTADLRIRRWSKRAEEMFGLTEAEVLGRALDDWRFVHDDDRERVFGIAAQVIAGNDTLMTSRNRNYRKDGGVVWCHWYISVLRDERGNVTSMFTLAEDITEQQLAITSLNDSEARFRSIFEQAATGMILIDEAGTLLSVNERTCEMFSYATSELIGVSLEEFTPVEDRPEFTERMGSVETRLATLETKAKDGYSLERRCVRKDGAYFWVSVHVRKIAANAKFPAYAIATLIDITARKLAEQQAIEHQRVREFHFDNTPLAVIEWTPDLRVKRWSTRAEQMFGWTEAQVLGRKPFEWRFVHKDDLEDTVKVVNRLMSGQESLVVNLNRNYHKDGTVVWCHWYNSMLRDGSGTVGSMFSMVNDVTEQQFALEALNKSETRLRSTFDQAAVGMSLLNADGSWHTVNQRLCEITGYSMSELLASDYQTITLPEDLSLDLERARQLIEGEIDSYNIEKRYVHKQGHVVWVKVFASRINATATQPPLYVAVVLDINERKQAELEIRQLTAGLENKVAERTEQLQHTMQSWQERNRELSLLAEMMSVLPAANDAAEGNRIVAGYLPRLFSRCGGAYYVKDETTQRLMLKVKWGDGGELRHSFEIDDCWALRRKQSLRVEDPADPLHCPHLGMDHRYGEQQPHACMPILALGEVAGMIHLHWQERGAVDNSPPDSVMLANAAEQIGLALGNMRLREELRRQATRDPLTSLYNRRHFDEQLRQRIAEQARDPRGFAMLMVDLDHFKTINDRFGHDAGDIVLRETATLLQRAVRADEAVFRLGGEEFLIMLANGSGAEAAGCGERVRRDIERLHIEHGGQPLPTITASIGVACFPGDGCSGTALLKNADAALYVAKRTGRNRVCMASASLGPTPAAIAAVKSPPA